MRKRYLVPLDGSRLSEQALPWAKLLAEKDNTQIELMRCYEPLASTYMLPGFTAPPPVYSNQSSDHPEIDEYLQGHTDILPQGLAVKVACEGDPGIAILDRSESGEIKMVVMASHGRGGLGRWLLGSVATKVVRGNRVPVLIINASVEVPIKPRLKRILVPLDGSKTAETALTHAVELAKKFDASIVLYQGIAHTSIGNPQLDAAIEVSIANAAEYLKGVQENLEGVKSSVVVKSAGPQLGIVEQAEDCDLVVMSSHGRSGVKRWLLGSTAENILQTVRKPLLIVYRRDQE